MKFNKRKVGLRNQAEEFFANVNALVDVEEEERQKDSDLFIRLVFIRRDPTFVMQHYFLDYKEVRNPVKKVMKIYQFSPRSQKMEQFWSSRSDMELGTDYYFDERGRKIYFLFHSPATNQTAISVEKIDYDPPDSVGYRRAFLTKQKELFCGQNICGDPKATLNLWIVDKNENLFAFCVRSYPGRKGYFRNQVCQVVLNPRYASITLVFISNPFQCEHMTLFGGLHSYYSGDSKLNMLINLPSRNKYKTPRSNQFRLCTFDYSAELKIEIGQMFKPQNLISISPPYFQKLFKEGYIFLLGPTYKYVFFGSWLRDSQQQLLAVKSLEKAVVPSAIPRIQIWSPSQISSYKNSFSKIWSRILVTGEEWKLVSMFVADKKYFATFLEKEQLMQIEVAVPTQFKDYRSCAKCKRTETSKRKDKNGKRIARYKICRICKQKNFHLRWWEFPCHYCSTKCLRKHWNKHKELHKKPALDRDE